MCLSLIVALTLLLQTSAASAGIIILPESVAKKNCWVWMVPPTTVTNSAADFLSRLALGLLPKSGLSEPGQTTLDLLTRLNAGRIRVEIKENQTQPFQLTGDHLTLSVDAADKIVRARNDDPAQLLETTSSVDPELAAAWLEQLGTGKGNLWDETETRLRWRHATTGADPKSFALSSLELARKLWPKVTEARNDDNNLAVAHAFDAETLNELEDSNEAMGKPELAPEFIKAFIQQNDFRTPFLQLGLRAAKLATAQRQLTSGALKPSAGKQLVQKLQTNYDEVYGMLASQLQTGLIIIPTKWPK